MEAHKWKKGSVCLCFYDSPMVPVFFTPSQEKEGTECSSMYVIQEKVVSSVHSCSQCHFHRCLVFVYNLSINYCFSV